MRANGPRHSAMPANPPPVILAELVETTTRAGDQMFMGRAKNGLPVRLVRSGERANAAGSASRCGG